MLLFYCTGKYEKHVKVSRLRNKINYMTKNTNFVPNKKIMSPYYFCLVIKTNSKHFKGFISANNNQIKKQ